MKKIIFIVLLAFGMNAKAQITLEHIYNNASSAGIHHDQLMIIKFDFSGEQYVRVNRGEKTIDIYNMNHVLLNTISLANVPLIAPYSQIGEILYISDNLFNTDSKKEFMYCYQYTDTNGNGENVTNIYNEDGIILFTDTIAPLVHPNWHMQQWPIYNTLNGTKMILSHLNGQAKVFNLPGTLSVSIAEANSNLLAQSSISNPFPNPAINTTRIDYELPNGINQGVIVLFDVQGKEIKRFKVDRTFDFLFISTSDIPSGTYFYQLQTIAQNSKGKKMIVIK